VPGNMSFPVTASPQLIYACQLLHNGWLPLAGVAPERSVILNLVPARAVIVVEVSSGNAGTAGGPRDGAGSSMRRHSGFGTASTPYLWKRPSMRSSKRSGPQLATCTPA